MDLNNLIRFENENTNLDFKAIEYWKKDKVSLLKDFISMANAANSEDKYIIIGVKDVPGHIRERVFIGLENFSDQADLENIIQENIEPIINFKYFTHELDDKIYGIIKIFNNHSQPYMMKKNFGKLEQGNMWIRRGSRQSNITRSDIDDFFTRTRTSITENDIKISFDKHNENTVCLKRVNFDDKLSFPSQKKKTFYEQKLEELSKYISEEKAEESPGIFNFLREYDPSTKKILMFNDQMGLPVRWNENEIEKAIENVENAYFDEDEYHLFENLGEKLNIYIFNDSNKFLEDVKLEFNFDSTLFAISESKPIKPYRGSPLLMQPLSLNIPNTSGYPFVDNDGKYYTVEEKFSKIRHKEFQPIFQEELRIFVRANADFDKSEIRFKISARNLATPVEGVLYIEICE